MKDVLIDDSKISVNENNWYDVVVDNAEHSLDDLVKSKRRLQLALEAGQMGTWEWNLSTNAATLDDFCLSLFGLKSETFDKNSASIFASIHPEDEPHVSKKVHKAIETHSLYEAEFRVVHSDGAVKWLCGVGHAIYNQEGKALQMFGINYDITGRKQAEEVLNERNALLEQTHDAVFTWEIGGGIIYWNRSATKLYGYAEPEALGKASKELLKTVFPKSFADFLAELRQNGHWEGELWQTGKSGRVILVESRLVTLKKNDGKTIVLETCRDVTERKRLDSELARASQLTLTGELIAGLAHEIKNPLAGIKGVVDTLVKCRKRGDEEREILESVSREVTRIDRTIRSLLSRTRPKTLQLKETPLNETVHLAVQIANHHAISKNGGKKKLIIESHFPPEPFIIVHDAAQIEDAVLNLILNAMEAVKNNGRITVSLSKSVYEAVIEVSDNGHGIPAGDLPKIWKPFYSKSKNGTGLGLTAVKRIAEMHGGSCEVSSVINRGSTFKIRLPRGV